MILETKTKKKKGTREKKKSYRIIPEKGRSRKTSKKNLPDKGSSKKALRRKKIFLLLQRRRKEHRLQRRSQCSRVLTTSRQVVALSVIWLRHRQQSPMAVSLSSFLTALGWRWVAGWLLSNWKFDRFMVSNWELEYVKLTVSVQNFPLRPKPIKFISRFSHGNGETAEQLIWFSAQWCLSNCKATIGCIHCQFVTLSSNRSRKIYLRLTNCWGSADIMMYGRDYTN